MDEEERNEELFHHAVREFIGWDVSRRTKSAAATARQELLWMFPEGRAEERSCNGPPRTIMWDVS
jgi:hypothetical protein